MTDISVCTCEMTAMATLYTPEEWEQDPFCPTHPDQVIIERARVILSIVARMIEEARAGTWNSSVRSNQLISAWLGLPLDTKYDALWDHLNPDPAVFDAR